MRRDRALAGVNIIVQVIHIGWDKSARGGEAAERRNRVPLALELSDTLAPQPGKHLLVHRTDWGQTNDFTSPHQTEVSVLDTTDGFRFDCVTVRPIEEGAELAWTWKGSGKPPRHSYTDNERSHRSIARENQWVRVRWNARHSCMDTGQWWYNQITVNVGVCPTVEIPPDFFTGSQPVDDHEEMERLF